jgi:hypothetical protein
MVLQWRHASALEVAAAAAAAGPPHEPQTWNKEQPTTAQLLPPELPALDSCQ